MHQPTHGHHPIPEHPPQLPYSVPLLPPPPSLPVSPEVAALLLQRLRKDVAAAAAGADTQANAAAAARADTEASVVATEVGAEAAGPRMPAAAAGAAAATEILPSGSVGHSQLLTFPWPLQLACQLLCQSLQCCGSQPPQDHTPPVSTVAQTAAAAADAQNAQPRLCVRAPVPAHADLCASALSVVRLIGLRGAGTHTSPLHSTAQGGSTGEIQQSLAGAAHMQQSSLQISQQSLRCLYLLRQEVLVPLSVWIHTRLKELCEEAGLATEDPQDAYGVQEGVGEEEEEQQQQQQQQQSGKGGQREQCRQQQEVVQEAASPPLPDTHHPPCPAPAAAAPAAAAAAAAAAAVPALVSAASSTASTATRPPVAAAVPASVSAVNPTASTATRPPALSAPAVTCHPANMSPAQASALPLGAAPPLPDVVAEYTALSRLEATVEAVEELCPK